MIYKLSFQQNEGKLFFTEIEEFPPEAEEEFFNANTHNEIHESLKELVRIDDPDSDMIHFLTSDRNNLKMFINGMSFFGTASTEFSKMKENSDA